MTQDVYIQYKYRLFKKKKKEFFVALIFLFCFTGAYNGIVSSLNKSQAQLESEFYWKMLV